MSKLYLYGLGAIALAAVIAGGWWWIDSIVSANARLAADNAKLTTAIDEQKAALAAVQSHMTKMAEDMKAANAALSGLHETMGGIRADAAEAVARLQRHDLGRIANAKPGLLESRINSGHRSLADSLRKASAGDQHRTAAPASDR